MTNVSYVTLEEFRISKSTQGLDGILDEKDSDETITFYLRTASRNFDLAVSNGVKPGRWFYPLVATYQYPHPVVTSVAGGVSGVWDSTASLVKTRVGRANLLRLNRDLLELTTLTTKNGATTITASDYVLIREYVGYEPPYNAIMLEPDGTVTEFEYQDTRSKANSVTGIWGYHNNWDEAWVDTGDEVEDDPLTATSTTLTVNDADGDLPSGLPYRFRRLQILRVEDEYMEVEAVDPANDTLQVRRGVLGSTAVQHAQNTQIDYYETMYDVRQAVLFWARHLYKRVDSVGTPDQRPLAAAKGLLVFPPSVPSEVKDVVQKYRLEAL